MPPCQTQPRAVRVVWRCRAVEGRWGAAPRVSTKRESALVPILFREPFAPQQGGLAAQAMHAMRRACAPTASAQQGARSRAEPGKWMPRTRDLCAWDPGRQEEESGHVS
jgi:hypothetical protein